MNGNMKEESKSNPWEIRYLNRELNSKLLESFRGERTGFIQVGPSKYFLPQKFALEGIAYYNFKPLPTDTWVVTFPRSGTTWTQEMVWLLGNDLNFTMSRQIPLIQRFPFLEFSSCVNEDVFSEFIATADKEETKRKLKKACSSVLEDLNKMTEPRFIKSHLPFSLLSPELLTCGAKVIYVARNPKDVAVSYYNFHQFIKTLDFVGDFKTFWNYFEQNLEQWTPYWDHVNEAWAQKKNPNLLFLFYEDLKRDLEANVKKLSKFLGKKYNQREIDELVNHLRFDNFQSNNSVNMEILRDLGMLFQNNQKCIRQGKSGGWREYFTPELNEQANKWIKKNLEKSDLKFPEV